MDTDKINLYVNKLTEEEHVKLIKEASQVLFKLQKQKDKALNVELETSAHCSRAKRTTLYANSHKISVQYNEQVELLKQIVLKL